MIALRVWMTLPDARIVEIGMLACGDSNPQGFYESEFQYSAAWLENPAAFPVDPIHLPLRTTVFATRQFYPPLSVFEDALPDDWGRSLLVKSHRLARKEQATPFLLRAQGADGLGALIFGTESRPLPQNDPVTPIHLPLLLMAARGFEQGAAVDGDALRQLFAAGSSPGGARPKALVQDARGSWIAKFSSAARDGIFDTIGLEATCMQLARAAGLDVADTELISVSRRKVLLVKRFDMAAGGGRHHMISLKSLYEERPGAYALGYSDLAQVIRKISAQPAEDLARFYRQMVFNAAIGNTDDHLKNFWMLYRPEGYRLSPAFDLVPDVAGNHHHLLQFQYSTAPPARQEVQAIAAAWGVRKASAIIDQVSRAVANFHRRATDNKVHARSIDRIGADISARLALLRG